MNEIVENYLKIPEVLLLALTKLDSKKSINIELKITENWIKNKKCICAENPNIQNKKISLNCKHINNEINKKTKKIEEQLKIKSDVLLFKRLNKLREIQQRLNTF